MWFFGKEKIKIDLRKRVEIRLEAIGGQGANSAGKILAEAAVLGQNFTGNHFSSFGSEKRGTPVKSFVRFSTDRQPVRSASAIRNPNLLVIFHEYMIETHPEVFDGIGPDTDVLVNTAKLPHEIAFPKGCHPRWIGTLDATKISRAKKCGLNVVLLGAMSPFLPELKEDGLQKIVEHFFERLTADEKAASVSGFKKGASDVMVKTMVPNQDKLVSKPHEFIHLGYENAPLGGIIVHPGNSILKSHESSRKGFAPRWNKDTCFHCGMCDQVCPDFCFVWKKNPDMQFGAELLGLDYQFCKGCQKCIEVCPVEALTLSPESEIPKSEKSISFGGKK